MRLLTKIYDYFSGKSKVIERLGNDSVNFKVQKVTFNCGKTRYYPMKRVGQTWIYFIIDPNEGKYKTGVDFVSRVGYCYNHVYYFNIKHAYKAIINYYINNLLNINYVDQKYEICRSKEIIDINFF